MKNIKFSLPFLSVFTLCLLVVSACYLDETNPGIITTGYNSLEEFYAERGAQTQIFQENLDSDLVITGEQGTVVEIAASDLVRSNGSVATGKVKVELKEIYKKSQMILSNMPTVSQGEVLESGGELYLTITDENQEELSLKNGARLTANMPLANSSNIENPNDMQVFFGVEDLGFSWIANQNGSVEFDSLNDSFSLLTDRFGWINCDYFYQSTAPKTTVRFSMNLPGANSPIELAAFIVFSNINSVMGMNYDDTDKEFFKANIPVDQAVNLVVVGMDVESFYFAQEAVVISPNLTLNIKVDAISEADLINSLEGLN